MTLNKPITDLCAWCAVYPEKRDQCFCDVFCNEHLGDSNKIWSTISWINLLQSDINVLFWIQLIIARRSSARESIRNTHQWSERTEAATDNGVSQLDHRHHCGNHLSVASFIAPDQWCAFCALSLAIFLACCCQLESNLANLEDTDEVGLWALEFLTVTTQR